MLISTMESKIYLAFINIRCKLVDSPCPPQMNLFYVICLQIPFHGLSWIWLSYFRYQLSYVTVIQIKYRYHIPHHIILYNREKTLK